MKESIRPQSHLRSHLGGVAAKKKPPTRTTPLRSILGATPWSHPPGMASQRSHLRATWLALGMAPRTDIFGFSDMYPRTVWLLNGPRGGAI